MPAEIEPAELARLVDFSERPRTQEWSLRSALVRYAQPQPQRVNDILDVVRRIEFALHGQSAVIERDGEDLWNALEGGPTPADHEQLVGLLRAAQQVDALGDVLAVWAVDRKGEQPDAEVDRVVADVAGQLDALGIAREERTGPPPRGRR